MFKWIVDSLKRHKIYYGTHLIRFLFKFKWKVEKKAREEEREKILKELEDLRIDEMKGYIKNLKNKE